MTFKITSGMRSKRLRQAAMAYAKAGIKVLALHGVSEGKCHCGNPACKNIGKHPITAAFPKGLRDATTDLETIARVWTKYPNANIGLAPDGDLGVLDFDGDIGLKTAESLELPPTVTVITGRGEHRYFIGFPNAPLEKRRKVDVRANGNGYVCAPPSMHASGKRYCFADGTDTAAPFPAHLRTRNALSIDFEQNSLTASEGQRNNKLTSYAGNLRATGFPIPILRAALEGINQHVCKPPLDKKEIAQIARSISRYPTKAESAIGSLSEVEPEEVEFLFEPYIPKGALSILDGHPGQGKSTFCTALIAAITTGKKVPWANDAPHGLVLIFSAEDDPARVMLPRLLAQGADPQLVRYQREPFQLDESGIAILRQDVEQHRPCLVIIDPMTAYLAGDTEMNNAVDMTIFMGTLDKVARDFNCAILLVRHLRKAGDDNALHMGLGSVAISGRIRSGLILGRHPDDPDLRVVIHVKSNYAKEGDAITFSMQTHGKVAKICWEETDSDITFDRMFASPREPGRPAEKIDLAVSFLRHQLSGGSIEKSNVMTAAEAQGVSGATLRRAACHVGVKFIQRGKKSFWALPDQDEADD